ncbi:MAG: hypothetical protein M3Y87_21170 [Myxococcota bacterium]|nr:hypothetical protein [Myxococcota bacterium]
MSGMLRVGTVLCALALVACGSNEEASPVSGGGAAVPTAPTAPGGGCGDPAEAREVAEDPSFELRASASGPYATGQEGRFEIALTPRGGYHVNADYPLTIELEAPGEVTLPDAELGADDAAEFGEPRARFQVPFTPTGAGQHRVTARVDFAVCTPEACMPDCRTLALVLPVEAGGEAPTTATQ